MEANVIEIGFINVVASPHPAGIYPESFSAVANQPIRLRGRDYAIITPPVKVKDEPGLFEGVISVWTDIDSSEPSIDKATFLQKDVEAALKKVFDERGFNNRAFSYILDEETHTVAVELKNSIGKTFSVRQAGKLFELLLSKLSRKGQTYDVTIMPEEDALSRVLGLTRIDKITIVLKRPNPGDHHGTDAEDILQELHEQNMKRAEYIFTRQSGTDGIHLNEENQTKAEVASTNGHVESSGIVDGEKAHRSTQQYPKVLRRVLAAGTLFSTALKSEVKRFRG